MRYFLILVLAFGVVLLVLSLGCDKKNPQFLVDYYLDDPPWTEEGGAVGGCGGNVPPDPANVNVPDVNPDSSRIRPSAGIGLVEGTESCVQVTIAGLINPETGDPIVPRPNVNIFILEDGEPQGFSIVQVSESNVALADVVFTVDNSGSMFQEADSIASGIIEFAQQLEASGLDVRFGCVGYWGSVSGAVNFTTADSLEMFLNRGGAIGTSRTIGFWGPDSADLANAAPFFGSGGGENGVDAIFYADSVFDWRGGAQRHYVNFTDEPTQPNGDSAYSTDALCNEITGSASVHSVYSGGDTTWTEDPLQREHPWRMAECTGGTSVFVQSDASDLDLSQLPIIGFLANTYIIQFTSSDGTVAHTLEIIVTDGDLFGILTFEDLIYNGP